MKYDKLIRDRIEKIIKDNGEIPITHIADDMEYWSRLRARLHEEADEVFDGTNLTEELADVL